MGSWLGALVIAPIQEKAVSLFIHLTHLSLKQISEFVRATKSLKDLV
jgi:hypothetical protein